MVRGLLQLIRKLADILDGIDVSGHAEGDVLNLPRGQAQLSIAEQWAAPLTRASEEPRGATAAPPRTVAADGFRRSPAAPSFRSRRIGSFGRLNPQLIDDLRDPFGFPGEPHGALAFLL